MKIFDINLIVLSYQLFAFQGRNLIEIMKFLTIFGLFLLANLTQSLQFDCPELVGSRKRLGQSFEIFLLRSSGIFSDPDDCQCIYECASDVPYQICCGEGTKTSRGWYFLIIQERCGTRTRKFVTTATVWTAETDPGLTGQPSRQLQHPQRKLHPPPPIRPR